MLDEKQVAFYRKEGYIGVEGVLNRAETEELGWVTDEFVERSRQVSEHDDIFDLEPGHSAERPRLRRIKNPAAHHSAYDRALRHPEILGIVAQLIGPAIRYNGQKLNLKSAEFGSPVEWHQDWAFYPHTNDDLLAVGIALDDMTLKNGCLLVIPGSHQGPILDHHQGGRFVGAVTQEGFDDGAAVPVELRAGGISIHHARMLHGSLPNTSARPRRLLLFQYCAGDAWPVMGSSMEAWEQSLLCGHLTYQPRVTPVPIRLPLPPAVRQGSIYETQTVLEKSTFKKAREKVGV
ncbi:MAG: phytanoyl-CoA dioxygenase family protein [Candidatus Handelsmanbacteria bacterium]|nr:phytanoyl-CoA dioxygenase family protein [Candidatus Handelsmanbacteria bacterium]